MPDSLLEGLSDSKSSIDRAQYMKYLQELRLQDGQDDMGQSLGRLPRKGKFQNGFSGYNFVNDPEFLRDPNQKLMPWMPRPVEDVCKTYGHIFRLLTDPRVRSMQQGSAGPQKHSINVSVPTIPTLYSTGGSLAGSAEDSADLDDFVASEGDAYDAQAPLPAVREAATKNGQWRSKSSPSLMTGLSGASTTAGTMRPSSFGAGAGSSGSSDLSLPTLSVTVPMHARPDQHPLDGMASGIDTQSRRPGTLLAGTL